MTVNNLNADGEFRYIVQWFNEWSGLQRDDFIPVLKECLTEEPTPVFINGIGNNGAPGARPMSLFQCRIKLFREWTPKWPTELRYKLRDTLFEIDSKICEKLVQNNSIVHEVLPADGMPEVASEDTRESTCDEKDLSESLSSEKRENSSNDTISISDNEIVNDKGQEQDINIPKAQENEDIEKQSSNLEALII